MVKTCDSASPTLQTPTTMHQANLASDVEGERSFNSSIVGSEAIQKVSFSLKQGCPSPHILIYCRGI